jgi:hypothetical protein
LIASERRLLKLVLRSRLVSWGGRRYQAIMTTKTATIAMTTKITMAMSHSRNPGH